MFSPNASLKLFQPTGEKLDFSLSFDRRGKSISRQVGQKDYNEMGSFFLSVPACDARHASAVRAYDH